MSGSTARLGLTYMQGTDLAASIDDINQTQMNQLDGIVPHWASGTFAARPAAGHSGYFYYATDTGRLYYDNGAAWKFVSIDATDVIEAIFGNPRMLKDRAGIITAPAAGTYLLGQGSLAVSPASGSIPYGWRFDPADHAAGSRTVKVRVRGVVAVNGTAPAVNFTFGLYPITFSGGATVFTQTVGALVTGSGAAVNAPGANGASSTDGAWITAPAAGAYCLACVVSGAAAANSAVELAAELQMQQV